MSAFIRQACLIALAVTATGAGATGEMYESQRFRGGEAAGGCVQMLRAGPLGLPLMVMCLPLVGVAAALQEVPRLDADDGTTVPEFAFPSSYSPGCKHGECEGVP